MRFPEFYTFYTSQTISSIFKLTGGGTPSTKEKKYWLGTMPWISSSDLLEFDINKISETRFISNEAIENSATKIVPAFSILVVTRVGLGKVAVNEHPICTSQDFTNLYSNNVNPYYFAYLIQKHLSKKAPQGSTIKGISNKELAKMNLAYPTKNEQDKIYSFLHILDKKIDVISSKMAILKKYKEGLFLDTRKCSKRIVLKSILSEVNIKTKYNNQYEILSSTAIGLFSQKEYFKHQVASENNVGYKVIKKGQLLFSPQNLWLGNINLNNDFEIGMVSPSYKIYDIDNSINSTCLISMLKSQNMLYKYKQISEQGASVVRRNLDISKFLEITLDIPENQIQIGITLETIDKKINALSNLLIKLKNFKTHLLNKMFI